MLLRALMMRRRKRRGQLGRRARRRSHRRSSEEVEEGREAVEGMAEGGERRPLPHQQVSHCWRQARLLLCVLMRGVLKPEP